MYLDSFPNSDIGQILMLKHVMTKSFNELTSLTVLLLNKGQLG